MSGLPTAFQQFVHLSRYARWMEDKGRRETWDETVDRYVNFMCDEQCKGKIPDDVKEEIRSAILNLEVMPSMRAMMTAGEALRRDNISAFNCAGVIVDSPIVFDEILFLLMCFHPDTEVKTRNGMKKISEITSDDEVESYDDETGERVYIRPSRVMKNPTEKSSKLKLTFDDGSEVMCTAEHLFHTDRGWVKACDISEDDNL